MSAPDQTASDDENYQSTEFFLEGAGDTRLKFQPTGGPRARLVTQKVRDNRGGLGL